MTGLRVPSGDRVGMVWALDAWVMRGQPFPAYTRSEMPCRTVRRWTNEAPWVLRALTAFGAPVEQHHLTAADFAREGSVDPMGQPPRPIDVRTSIEGVGFETVARGRIVARLEGPELPVIGLRERRRNKRAAGRPEELLDLALLDEAGRGEGDEG